jgi:serine protease inhibitor
VTHVAKLVVNKKGTEGAAVTVIDMMATAAPYEEYKKVYETFVVDQEFGYVVSYNNNVLFSGVVTNIDK